MRLKELGGGCRFECLESESSIKVQAHASYQCWSLMVDCATLPSNTMTSHARRTFSFLCKFEKLIIAPTPHQNGVHNLLASSLTRSFSANSQDQVECDLILWHWCCAQNFGIRWIDDCWGQHMGRWLATVAGDWRMYGGSICL